MMNPWPIEIGSVVISKAGRDRGRPFLVVGVVDDDFVMVANGALRKMDRQKAPEAHRAGGDRAAGAAFTGKAGRRS